MKSAIETAAAFYASHGLNLAKDLEYHLKWGCVISFPDRLILAREIKLENGPTVYCPPRKGDAWFIQFATGKNCLSWFLKQATHLLPNLAWYRIKDAQDEALRSLHVISTQRFNRLLSHK